MRVLVTGTSGHLGEALVRELGERHDVVGLDLLPSPYTSVVGSITDRALVRRWLEGVQGVLHTATLHKPHVGSHAKQAFVDTNVTGTLTLLEEAVSAGVGAFVFTSTTSAFGRALTPPPGSPAAWIDETVVPIPKNVYGATKVAAEDLCELVHREHGLPVVVLRTSRFFPEPDDSPTAREQLADDNLKAIELLYRRVDLADVVSAHELALEQAGAFRRYVISAPTPFTRDDLPHLPHDAAGVVERHVPWYVEAFAERGWFMLPGIERVYDSSAARRDLGWAPVWDFAHALTSEHAQSDLARAVGAKGYHATSTGIYTTRR